MLIIGAAAGAICQRRGISSGRSALGLEISRVDRLKRDAVQRFVRHAQRTRFDVLGDVNGGARSVHRATMPYVVCGPWSMAGFQRS